MRSPLPSRPAPASPPPPRKFTQQAALQLCLSGTGVTQPPSTKRATAGQPRYSRTGRSPSRLRNRARPTGRLNRLRGNAANACYHWPRRQPATVTSNHPTIGMIMSPAQHGSDRGIAPPIRSATRSRLTLTELAGGIDSRSSVRSARISPGTEMRGRWRSWCALCPAAVYFAALVAVVSASDFFKQ